MAQPKHLRLDNVLLLFALLAMPVAVAPWLARAHWSIDLVACFPVQAMGLLVLAALWLAVCRRWRAAGACALFAAIAAAAVVPDWLRTPPGPGPTAAAAETPPVRLLALNLLRGNHDHVAEALAVVRAERPDVLFCSEVTPEWCAGLAEALTELPHRHLAADAGYYGVALFSRWPLTDATTIPLGTPYAPALRATIAAPHGPLGLLGVHTPRPGDARRNQERDRALAAIPAAVRGLPRAHLVLGDHNATPWTPTLRALLDDGSLRAATFATWLPSWPTQWPLPLRIPIDHALLGPGLDLVEVHVGEGFGSDHLPLAVAVRISPR